MLFVTILYLQLEKAAEPLPWICPLWGCWVCEPRRGWVHGLGGGSLCCSGLGDALRAHSLSFPFVSSAGVTNGFAKHAGSGSDSECSSALGSGLVFEACR